jgi:DNA invertase Pin-like site-specific DNA recombinase
MNNILLALKKLIEEQKAMVWLWGKDSTTQIEQELREELRKLHSLIEAGKDEL